MAYTIQVDGAALVRVCAVGGTLADLGYTENGSEITEQLFTGDVHTDENGGDAGPPSDIQYFGEMHIVRLLLTKYDETVINTIRTAIAGGAGGAGKKYTPGSLYFQGLLYWRLLINTPSRPRNYWRAVFREPKEINKGTKHSKALIVAHCYHDPLHLDGNSLPIIYDTTTS